MNTRKRGCPVHSGDANSVEEPQRGRAKEKVTRGIKGLPLAKAKVKEKAKANLEKLT